MGNAVTVTEAKSMIRIESTDADTLIGILIDQVESFVERRCNLKLTSASREDKLDGGGIFLWPKSLPVTAVSAVTDLSNDDTDFDDYLIQEEKISYNTTYETRWGDGPGRWKLEYTGGYAAANIPAGLKGVILQLVARLFDNRQSFSSSQSGAGEDRTWMYLEKSDIYAMLQPFILGAL